MSEQTDSQQKPEEATIGTSKYGSTTVEVPVATDDGAQASTNQQSDQQQPPTSDDESRLPSYGYGILKRHMNYDPLSIVFALLVFAAGIVGFVTKDSTASLVSGTIFAILLGAATFIEGSRKNAIPLIVVLLALGGMMAWRYSINMVFIPAGLIALVAFLMAARHCYLFYLRRQPIST